MSISGRSEETCCIPLTAAGFTLRYSVLHLKERRSIYFIGYLLAEHLD